MCTLVLTLRKTYPVCLSRFGVSVRQQLDLAKASWFKGLRRVITYNFSMLTFVVLLGNTDHSSSLTLVTMMISCGAGKQ